MKSILNKLVKSNDIKPVVVKKASDELLNICAKQYLKIFKQKAYSAYNEGLPANHCQDVSICAVRGMHEIGEQNWSVVYGYAYGRLIANNQSKVIVRHIWIKNGDNFYDPTWSLKYHGWINFKKTEYFKLIDDSNESLKEPKGNDLEQIIEWGNKALRFLENFAKLKGLEVNPS